MRRMTMICAPVVIALVITGVALAAIYRGRTSQGKKVEVGMAARHELKSLILVFSTRCSNNQKREFSTGFVRPFRIPQNAAGAVGDTIHVLGGSFLSPGGFKQTASFSATVGTHRITGTARLKETLRPSGLPCRSGRVHFRAAI